MELGRVEIMAVRFSSGAVCSDHANRQIRDLTAKMRSSNGATVEEQVVLLGANRPQGSHFDPAHP